MKTTKILLALSLFATASLSAAEGKFKLATKVIVLPQEELGANHKLDGSISDGEMQLLMRDISKIEHAKISIRPTFVLNLNEVGHIEIVSEKKVTRIDSENLEKIGDTVTYRLESIDGVLTLDGILKHSEMNEDEKPGVIAINTEEIIFKRNCELDKSILVSKGDIHIFITLTQWK